jgi:hypothetical protein
VTADTARFDDDISAADGDEIEIVFGRGELPWTQVHDWVALSGIGTASIAAYLFLKMHLNRHTGLVNPGTVRLAALLGLPRADKVAAVIRPLVKIGAVEVKTYGMPRRNRYIVHSLPPDNYAGPLSIGQWTKTHASKIDQERQKHAKKAQEARNRRSDPVTTNTGLLDEGQTDSSVAPESGLQVAPESGVHVPPDSGLEPDVAQPDVEPPPPVVGSVTTVVLDARDEEEEQNQQNPIQIARDVLRRVTTGLSSARLPNHEQAGHLISFTVDALRAGWHPDDLVRRIGDGDLTRVDSVYAVLRHRIGSLGAPTERRGPTHISEVDKPHTMSPDASWRESSSKATPASDEARRLIRETIARRNTSSACRERVNA